MIKVIGVHVLDSALSSEDQHTFVPRPDIGSDRACRLLLEVSFLYCLAAALVQSSPAQPPHQDNQTWHEIDISSKVGTRLDLALLSQVRLSSTLPNPEIYLFGLDVNVTVNRHLVITPSYYFYRFERPTNTLGYGQNPDLAATVKWERHGYTVEDRNRFVAVLRKDDNFWMYGNRLRVERNVGCATGRDFLFVWDELFYFSNTGAWRRNRVAVGFHKTFDERMAVEPYYLHQTDGHSRPGDLDTLGIILRVRLR
jgi:hypothetical protein